MKKIFYPGCRIKAGYPEGSEKLRQYMIDKYGLEAVNCCKVDYTLLEQEDLAVLICNNCRKDLEKNVENLNVEFVYELIDQDDTFHFPNYHHQRMVLQDCGHGYNGHNIEQTVRSLLDKMNIDYIELDKSQRVVDGMSHKEHSSLVTLNAASFKEKDVITYCAICNLAYIKANKNTHLLLDLLFNTIGYE